MVQAVAEPLHPGSFPDCGRMRALAPRVISDSIRDANSLPAGKKVWAIAEA